MTVKDSVIYKLKVNGMSTEGLEPPRESKRKILERKQQVEDNRKSIMTSLQRQITFTYNKGAHKSNMNSRVSSISDAIGGKLESNTFDSNELKSNL